MRTLFGPNVSGRLLTRSQFTRATTRDVCYERGTDAPGGIFGPKNKIWRSADKGHHSGMDGAAYYTDAGYARQRGTIVRPKRFWLVR